MFNAAPYLQGDVFDAVMNYRWAREACHFFIYSAKSINATELDRRLRSLLADYPSDVNYVLMNLYSSHDTDRLGSMIVNTDASFDKGVSARDNPAYNVRKPTPEERKIQRLMVLFQMSFLGAPMVYYGDEAGMWGGDDPDCRKPMVWPEMEFMPEERHPLGRPRPVDKNGYDKDLADYYRSAIQLRNGHRALRTGSLTTLLTNDADGVLVYLRSAGDEHVIVALNRSGSERTVDIPLPAALRSLAWKPGFQAGPPLPSTEGVTCVLAPVSGSVLVHEP
jgi:glycosidase